MKEGVHVIAYDGEMLVFDAWLPEAPMRDDYLVSPEGWFRIVNRTWSEMTVRLEVRREWAPR